MKIVIIPKVTFRTKQKMQNSEDLRPRSWRVQCSLLLKVLLQYEQMWIFLPLAGGFITAVPKRGLDIVDSRWPISRVRYEKIFLPFHEGLKRVTKSKCMIAAQKSRGAA